MNKIFGILFLLAISSVSTLGQDANVAITDTVSVRTYTIKGSVADSVAKKEVAFATISVMKDSVSPNYIKRFAADHNGKFEFEVKLEKPSCLLVFEATGKETFAKYINFENETKVDVGKIFLNDWAYELTGVEVTAAKPLVTVDIDKIIYNTQSDPESKTENVLEMLRKVPLVTVDGEDNIQVKGSSSFKVYVNGKPSNVVTNNVKDALKSMPASSVKNIEIITEPGAKYDAEGVTAIINIVTERALKGYTANVSAGVKTQGDYHGNIYFSTKIGKFGLTANAGYYSYRRPYTSESHQQYLTQMPYIYSDTYGSSKYRGNSINGSIEASYEFDSLNLVSLSFSTWNGKGGSLGKNTSTTYLKDENKNILSAYQNISSSNNFWGGFSGNVDYQKSFKKPDKLLTMSYLFDLNPNNNDNTSQIKHLDEYLDTLKLNPVVINQKLISVGMSNEHTFQIDYTEPFNKKHFIEGGLKYILRLNGSDNQYWLFNDTTQKYDIANSNKDVNNLNYTQNILGAYGSYTFKLEKFSVRAGIRFEYTGSDVRFVEHHERDFKAQFSNLIPSLQLTFKPSMTSNIRFGYRNSISRPGIWYLNPFVDDSDPMYISFGNPDLKVEKTHSFNLSYGRFTQKFNLNVGAYTSFTNNSIENVTTLQNDVNGNPTGVLISTYENIGKYNSTGGNIYINYSPIKILRLYANSSVGYTYYSNNLQTSDGIRWTFYGGTQITIPWKLKFSAGAACYSPWISYESKGSSYYYYYFSLNRSFLKDDKLTVGISTTNPFEKNRTWANTAWKDGIYKRESKSVTISRDFGVSISYRFGSLKEDIKKVERGISNDDVKKSGGEGQQGGSGQ
jgi:outer membrane receptor protein involved in Fe transport